MDVREGLQRLSDRGVLVDPDAAGMLDPGLVEELLSMDPAPDRVTEGMVETLRERRSGPEGGDSEDSTMHDGSTGAASGPGADTDTADEDDDKALGAVDPDRDTVRIDGEDVAYSSVDRPEYDVEVAKSFPGNMSEKGVEDFVAYYNDRFSRMRELLAGRRQLESPVSINRIDEGMAGEDVTLIAMVAELRRAQSGRMIMTLEDDTGRIRALADEDEGDRLIEDEVIGINGEVNDDGDFIYSRELIRPDIPLSRSVREADEEVHAAFISDIHYGSIDTEQERLENLLAWLHAGEGIAGTISYLFINGDVVEGVGVYPGQEAELERTDIYEQYELFLEFMERVPDDIAVIIGPGNHDGVRIAEPQPPLPAEFCAELHEMDNVFMVSNPSRIHIHGHRGDPLRVLMYHGYSFDRHVDAIPELREKGYEEPTHAMVDFLRRRHLAPTYGSNRLSPEDRDYMVIEEVPDIFVMGHTHAFDVRNYKSVNLISSGTMQSQTEFQKRMGHMPDPGEVAVVNLQTRDVTVKEVNPE